MQLLVLYMQCSIAAHASIERVQEVHIYYFISKVHASHMHFSFLYPWHRMLSASSHRIAFYSLIFGALLSFATESLATKSCPSFDESDEDTVCVMLFDQFERALIGNSVNVYKLRQVFFPSLEVNPKVVEVTYDVIFRNVSTEACAGADNDIIMIGRNNSDFIWTDSAVFSILHPRVFDWIQPQVLYWLNPITSSENYKTEGDVVLHLDVDFLSCAPSKDQVDDTLRELNTVVSMVQMHYHCKSCNAALTKHCYCSCNYRYSYA